MKIRVILTVDLDAHIWTSINGIELSEVRADVRRYIVNGLSGATGMLEESGAVVNLTGE